MATGHLFSVVCEIRITTKKLTFTNNEKIYVHYAVHTMSALLLTSIYDTRYECKVRNLKKRKVTIHVSVNGVRVVLKKRRRKKKNWSNEADEIELLNHPIYRIFYVSHDSSDLKIFSYIARDASTDTFKCSVFKSHKKSESNVNAVSNQPHGRLQIAVVELWTLSWISNLETLKEQYFEPISPPKSCSSEFQECPTVESNHLEKKNWMMV
ncbi:hypothetical protein GQX74_004156 [Glossina fuscipes]|nr:hypothetical protein GQX74_004156 [Glossina fuscipes]